MQRHACRANYNRLVRFGGKKMRKLQAQTKPAAEAFIEALDEYLQFKNRADTETYSPARSETLGRLKTELSSIFERAVEERVNERFADDRK